MKLGMSWVYAIIFAIYVGALGITQLLMGDANIGILMRTMFFVLGAGLVFAVHVFDKRTSIVSETQKQKIVKNEKDVIEPQQRTIQLQEPVNENPNKQQSNLIDIQKYISEKLNTGYSLQSVINALQVSGADEGSISVVINSMVQQGIIKIKKEELQPEEKAKDVAPEEPKKEEESEQEEEPEEDQEEKIKVSKKKKLAELDEEEKGTDFVCKRCKKKFESSHKLKRHIGMAHYKDLEI